MKKLLSVLLAAVLVICAMPLGMFAFNVEATSITQTQAVEWARSKIGIGLDYDGSYGNQCVDLIFYYYQYLGVGSYGGNACDYLYNSLPAGWQRLTVYEGFVPQPGDVAVWKTNHTSQCEIGQYSTGDYGHVGIITAADSDGFVAVNQNFNHISSCTSNWFKVSGLQCVIRPNFSSSTPLAVSSRESCNFRVAIPANYRFYLYLSETDTALSNRYYENSTAWEIKCVEKLSMSDGSIRFKVKTDEGYFYFKYLSNVMSYRQIHEYTNDCDKTCNLCGATRTVSGHSYTNACDKTCNICGATRTVSGHAYTNSCDKTCNVCGAARTITHTYSNNCDDTCNVCGTTRTPSDHVYDNNSDNTCNECGATRNTNWQIRVNETGVYDIQYTVITSGFNGISTIGVFDSKNNEVLYNYAKKGWPLIAGQNYTIKFYGRYDSIVSVDWDIIKISNTIFSDTYAGTWYNDAVTYSVGAGLITGYGGTDRFGTADNIQRQDFVVILARLAGVDLENYQSNRSSFADVPKGAYYEKAIMWAADCGITTGYAGGTVFGVGDKITREQLVTFLYRYAKHQNGGTAPAVSANAEQKAKSYADYNGVSDFAKEAVIWALDKGVIKGQGGTNIAPGGNALRCEIAQIMYNIFLNDIF